MIDRIETNNKLENALDDLNHLKHSLTRELARKRYYKATSAGPYVPVK